MKPLSTFKNVPIPWHKKIVINIKVNFKLFNFRLIFLKTDIITIKENNITGEYTLE